MTRKAIELPKQPESRKHRKARTTGKLEQLEEPELHQCNDERRFNTNTVGDASRIFSVNTKTIQKFADFFFLHTA
jgi:hypothetical protein